MAPRPVQMQDPISTPIVNQTNPMCHSIWNKTYIDLALLLPTTIEQSIPASYTLQIDPTSTISLEPSSKVKKIQAIETWTTAFIRYMAIYSTKCPNAFSQTYVGTSTSDTDVVTQNAPSPTYPVTAGTATHHSIALTRPEQAARHMPEATPPRSTSNRTPKPNSDSS